MWLYQLIMKMDVMERDMQELFKRVAELEKHVHNISILLTKEDDE